MPMAHADLLRVISTSCEHSADSGSDWRPVCWRRKDPGCSRLVDDVVTPAHARHGGRRPRSHSLGPAWTILRKSKEHCECQQLRIIRTVHWAFQAAAQHSSGRLGAHNSGCPWQSQLAGHAVRSERRTGRHCLAHVRPRRGGAEEEHEAERCVSQPGLSRLSELSF